MADLHRISNSRVPMNRPTLESALEALAAIQRVSAEAFAVLTDELDRHDGDPDLEAEEDADSDEQDQAWVEWDKVPANVRARAQTGLLLGEEDAEDDDPLDHGSGEDEFLTGNHHRLINDFRRGAGCNISDPGGCEHDGREPDCDAENRQMLDDVPMLPTFTAEHNIFTDRRVDLGISNLQSSFVAPKGIKSADTGAVHVNTGSHRAKPGEPV